MKIWRERTPHVYSVRNSRECDLTYWCEFLRMCRKCAVTSQSILWTHRFQYLDIISSKDINIHNVICKCMKIYRYIYLHECECVYVWEFIAISDHIITINTAYHSNYRFVFRLWQENITRQLKDRIRNLYLIWVKVLVVLIPF